MLETANTLIWSYQFNQEPSFMNATIRIQACRYFILWQQGRLEARRGGLVPVCVDKTVQERFSKLFFPSVNT